MPQDSRNKPAPPVDALLREVIPALCNIDADTALRLAVDALIRITGAERGLLAVESGHAVEIVEARTSERKPVADARRAFSRTILHHVLDTGESLCLADAGAAEHFAAAESVSQLKLLSVLAAPFPVNASVRGAVYLENRRVSAAFTDADVRLVAALAEGIGRAVANSLHLRALRESEEALRRELGEISGFEHIVGASPAFTAALRVAARGARSNLPVLIEGESGTGKELIARAVHRHSPRAERPLVSINCAAVPAALLEDELFGHVKGAFTGAEGGRRGLLASADGGTLFLDEIAEMSPALQANLLRALELGEYRPVGADTPLHADVRILAATHKDLEREAAEGRFRKDLYYRLKGVRVLVPPLRERPEDLGPLIERFLAEAAAAAGVPAPEIAPPARARLLSYAYPGNVRELRAAVHRAVLFAEDGVITPASLPPEMVAAGDAPPPAAVPATADELKDARAAARAAAAAAVERAFCRRALAAADGNVTTAARQTGMNRSQFQQMLSRLGLRGEGR